DGAVFARTGPLGAGLAPPLRDCPRHCRRGSLRRFWTVIPLVRADAPSDGDGLPGGARPAGCGSHERARNMLRAAPGRGAAAGRRAPRASERLACGCAAQRGLPPRGHAAAVAGEPGRAVSAGAASWAQSRGALLLGGALCRASSLPLLIPRIVVA